jgi:hypothetical protein
MGEIMVLPDRGRGCVQPRKVCRLMEEGSLRGRAEKDTALRLAVLGELANALASVRTAEVRSS